MNLIWDILGMFGGLTEYISAGIGFLGGILASILVVMLGWKLLAVSIRWLFAAFRGTWAKAGASGIARAAGEQAVMGGISYGLNRWKYQRRKKLYYRKGGSY